MNMNKSYSHQKGTTALGLIFLIFISIALLFLLASTKDALVEAGKESEVRKEIVAEIVREISLEDEGTSPKVIERKLKTKDCSLFF